MIQELKKILEANFIKESIYNFLPTKKPYSDLLTINNDDEFVSLSNDNTFIIPVFETDKNTIEKINDKLKHIFNREKYLICFQKPEFENMIYINIDDLIEHSVKNGTCVNNFYNVKLKEILGNKTYAQHRV